MGDAQMHFDEAARLSARSESISALADALRTDVDGLGEIADRAARLHTEEVWQSSKATDSRELLGGHQTELQLVEDSVRNLAASLDVKAEGLAVNAYHQTVAAREALAAEDED